MSNTVIQGYAEAANELSSQYEAISSRALYAPVLEHFPSKKCRVLDVGAGTGRDAAWLAKQGHGVVAVEPVAEFREAGQLLHGGDGIQWQDDRLPLLEVVFKLNQKFDLILVNAVFHHLRERERRLAICNFMQLLSVSGRVILSLRHGPFAASRPAYPVSAEEVMEVARDCGMKTELHQETASLQARNRKLGVTWTWLVFSLQS